MLFSAQSKKKKRDVKRGREQTGIHIVMHRISHTIMVSLTTSTFEK